jgi:hypothetical protein
MLYSAEDGYVASRNPLPFREMEHQLAFFFTALRQY